MFQVGFAGIGEPPPIELENKVRVIIRLLKNCCPNAIIMTGGYWGIMKTVVDEAIRIGLITVIFPPVEKEVCHNSSICIKSGLSYKNRSIPLVRSSNVLVVVGGGAGTLLELVTAYAIGVPVLVLANTGFTTDNVENCFGEYLDHRKTVKIHYYRQPKNLVQALCSLCRKGGLHEQ